MKALLQKQLLPQAGHGNYGHHETGRPRSKADESELPYSHRSVCFRWKLRLKAVPQFPRKTDLQIHQW